MSGRTYSASEKGYFRRRKDRLFDSFRRNAPLSPVKKPTAAATTVMHDSLSSCETLDSFTSLESSSEHRSFDTEHTTQSDFSKSYPRLAAQQYTKIKSNLSKSSLVQYRQYHDSMSYRNTTRELHNEKEMDRIGRRAGPFTSNRAQPTLSRRTSIQQDHLLFPNASEGTLVALQARRALQRLILTSREAEDTDRSSASQRASDSDSYVEISVDEYRSFGKRLKQLETICKEQAERESEIQKTVEMKIEEGTKEIRNQHAFRLRESELSQAKKENGASELIQILYEHLSIQNSQMERAKELLLKAIEGREEAEKIAKEAVELSLQLVQRLQKNNRDAHLVRTIA